MVFKDYYNSLPEKEKVELRNKIIQETELSLPTFYTWMRNESFPRVYRFFIAQIAGRPEEELFKKQ